jgi:hypothetical protein
VDGDGGRELQNFPPEFLLVPALWRAHGPISIRLRRLTGQAARNAVDGCEWLTQTGACVDFLEAAMPKQR